MDGKLANILVVLACTAIALGLAWLLNQPASALMGLPTLPVLAAIAFGLQWLMFMPAYYWQTEHYYDLTGSITYLLLVGLSVLATADAGIGARTLLLSVLISIWALRLGSFLFKRVRKAGKDGRFDEIKRDWARFLLAWTMQGMWVFLTLLAALVAMGSAQQSIDAWALLGAGLWLLGFAVEAVADAQKNRFKADPGNAGRFINVGLWRWSRHPNYFGEILLWIGIAVIALPTFAGWQWLALISPAFVTLLLTRVSGVPMLEQRADEKWGQDADYQAYRDATPVLVPWPPDKP